MDHHRRSVIGPVVVASVMVLGACESGEPPPAPAAVVVQSDEGIRPTIPSEPSAQLLRETRLFGNAAPIMAVQRRVGVAPVILDPGTYEFDALGTRLALTLPEHWRLDYEGPGTFEITRPGAELEALLPAVTFHRPFGFVDPALAGFGGPVEWIMQDVGEWIEAVPQVVVLDSGAIQVGDRLGRWWDVDVDPTAGPTISACEPGSCVKFMWSGRETHSVARDLERIRWYEIPDPQGPIVVFISTTEADFAATTADVDALLRTAVVGPSEPSPLRAEILFAREGSIESHVPTEVAAIGGVIVDAPYFLSVSQRPGELLAWRLNNVNGAERVGLVQPATTLAGEPIGSVDDIVAAIEANGSNTSLATGEIFGIEATVVDFEVEDDGVLLISPPRAGYSSSQGDWPTLQLARAWVFDSPVGPLIVSASGATASDLANAVDRVAWLVDLIRFCEPTDSCGGQR